jgi:hypothetical protein
VDKIMGPAEEFEAALDARTTAAVTSAESARGTAGGDRGRACR